MRMDKGARLWLHKTAGKNYWRVAGWCELDDLVQDGYMHWYRLVRRYPDVVDYKHMMRLFKITFINHLNDISKKRTKNYNILEQVETESEVSMDIADVLPRLAKAPIPVRTVVNLLASEEGRKRLREPYERRPDGTRETLNERLSRLTGLEFGINFSSEFKNILDSA